MRAAYNFDETLNTLQYAERAKSITLKAKKNTQLTEVTHHLVLLTSLGNL